MDSQDEVNMEEMPEGNGAEEEIASEPEDLRDRAMAFSCRIVKLYKHLSGLGAAGAEIGLQALRSGTNVGCCLEEAHALSDSANAKAKYEEAFGAAKRAHYYLRLLAETEIIPANRMTDLIAEGDELAEAIAMALEEGR